MKIQFQKELDRLKKHIVRLGDIVIDNIRDVIQALESLDSELAEQVISLDLEVDQKEVEIEEECLKLLALYQPVATDLRLVIAVMKINAELERIGDEAGNIAELIEIMATQERTCRSFDYSLMAEKVQYMLKICLESLTEGNQALAQKVLRLDDDVDTAKNRAYRVIFQTVKEKPEHAEYLIHMQRVAHHLERVADHATNIAEQVIYLTQGVIVRHMSS